MRQVTQKEMEAVLQLDGPSRVERFVKVVADTETAWGLWDDGWALMEDDRGRRSFPLWPALEYAQACSTGQWSTYEPREIALAEMLEELLPKLEASGCSLPSSPRRVGRG
jgi:hypothetical protein